MSEIAIQNYKTSIGELIIGVYNNELVLLDWTYRKMRKQIDKRICDGLQATFVEKKHLLIDEVIIQIEEYFQQKRQTFDVQIKLVGTPFQLEVWNALQEIPFGKTTSYLALSQQLNNEKAIRAIASANGANAISIIVPCHRVIGSDGSLIGYAGGLNAKKKLLQLEKALPQQELFT